MVWALLVWACGDTSPDPCDRMCGAAADLYGECLEDWGVAWADAGYDDEGDFRSSCETWAWEQRLLEEDAMDQGWTEDAGAVDRVCRRRADALSAEDAACDVYTDLDWSAPVWSEGAE